MIGQYALTTAQTATPAVTDDSSMAILSGALLFGTLAILALHALLFLGALVSVLGSPLTGGMKLVWVVVTFAAPVLGPLVWFVFGRRDAYRRMPAYWG